MVINQAFDRFLDNSAHTQSQRTGCFIQNFTEIESYTAGKMDG